MLKRYRGWWLFYNNPGVKPEFYATRFGVRVCSNTYEGLLKVIDWHIADTEAYYAKFK